jgi:hypothetical protein
MIGFVCYVTVLSSMSEVRTHRPTFSGCFHNLSYSMQKATMKRAADHSSEDDLVVRKTKKVVDKKENKSKQVSNEKKTELKPKPKVSVQIPNKITSKSSKMDVVVADKKEKLQKAPKVPLAASTSQKEVNVNVNTATRTKHVPVVEEDEAAEEAMTTTTSEFKTSKQTKMPAVSESNIQSSEKWKKRYDDLEAKFEELKKYGVEEAFMRFQEYEAKTEAKFAADGKLISSHEAQMNLTVKEYQSKMEFLQQESDQRVELLEERLGRFEGINEDFTLLRADYKGLHAENADLKEQLVQLTAERKDLDVVLQEYQKKSTLS